MARSKANAAIDEPQMQMEGDTSGADFVAPSLDDVIIAAGSCCCVG